MASEDNDRSSSSAEFSQDQDEDSSPKRNNRPSAPWMVTAHRIAADDPKSDQFMTDLRSFFSSRNMEFRIPKFYGTEVDLHKLWLVVSSLGGYTKVTRGKLWRTVGDNFDPPKSCTTLSWSFRSFYEKALLEYERHVGGNVETSIPDSIASLEEKEDSVEPNPSKSVVFSETPERKKRGRKAKKLRSMTRRSMKKVAPEEERSSETLPPKSQDAVTPPATSPPLPMPEIPDTPGKRVQVDVSDEGQQADWVNINEDSFEIYSLVPGLLRDQVKVQCDIGGKVVIAGDPGNGDSPWGLTPFKKVVMLPGSIDVHQTQAVMTLHGQLFVRVPFCRDSNATEDSTTL